MSNDSKKDFNARMNDSKDMPKIVILDEEASKKWSGKTMAKKYNADITCPLTCGIFVNIVAWASFQRNSDITPYWRVLKSDGKLNIKYPHAIELQKRLLEEEGHTIITKGTKNIKFYVKDFEKSLMEF